MCRVSNHPAVQHGDSSFVSLLSGWVQQGVENFCADQRILVDLALRQNTHSHEHNPQGNSPKRPHR